MRSVDLSINIEYKVSFIDQNNPIVNTVQIRPKHNIQKYIIQVINAIDIKNCDLLTTWSLYKEQMEKECLLSGNHAAHGEKGSADELRLDIIFNSEKFNRFERDYFE